MRTSLGTVTSLMAALFLTACGGGSEPPGTLIADTCNSTRLWVVQSTKSGTAIPDNNSQGINVRWDNQNCALKSVSTATLGICLKHPSPSDLVWTITPPSGNAVLLSVLNSWNTSDISCNNNDGKFQNLNLVNSLGNSMRTQGDWVLKVSDQQSGDEGTFIQWQLTLEGLK